MRPFAPLSKSLSDNPTRTATPTKSILKPVSSSLDGPKGLPDGSPDVRHSDESPSKRRKVFFDDVKNVTYEVGRRPLSDVKLEARSALEDHLRGDDGQYDMIKDLFARDSRRSSHPDAATDEYDEAPAGHELQAYIVALTSCMPILRGKESNGLVKAVLQCSWLGRDDAFAKAFVHFLAALVSAKGSYLLPVLSMMVDKFRYSRLSAWIVPDYPEISRDAMRERLHSALQYLLQMFPAATAVLENLLSTKFPFADDARSVLMAYVYNLLQLKDYVPDLRDEVLDLILDRLVKIDSQMQVDLEDLDDEVTAAVMYALREDAHTSTDWEDDDSADSDDDESVDSDDLDFDHVAARIKTVKDSVEKMDAVLDTLFAFYTPYFANPGSDKAFDMFTILLREFDYLVLPTYRSRHTQFLIFHFAQQHERLADAFCGQLIATAFQSNTPNVLKQAAAAYLASFVARAAHVPGSLVRTMFMLLLHHLEQYRKKFEPICRGPDLNRFHIYYSLVQATLYIFCFRWQDLVVSAPESVDPDDAATYVGQDLEWIGRSRKDLSAQIFSKLNPLKICAPVIVDEFAKLAHGLNFLYVFPLVEANKRIRLSQYLSSTYATGGALRDAGYDLQSESFHQLDPYFPFDPYQLPVSKRWLDGDYLHWKAVPGLNADEDDDSDDDEMDDEPGNPIDGESAMDDVADDSE